MLAGCESAPSGLATHSQFPTLHPEHNERTRGWLRFLWQKATTPDDWSYEGEEPHPWWDQYTSAPLLSYPRFDLSNSSYAVLLMADQTPAWREVYTRIMDELATRHTTFWAAIDWNTFIGPSPDRQNYPPGLTNQWPERVRGNYDAPGWTANGVEPWGLDPDPIGATGNLFFRGWLNLVLSIYKYVSGDDKWERPWLVAGYENEHFEWTQPRIMDYLRRQYTDQPEGPHCENTKIWPFCNSAAGLGIYLSDRLGGRPSHGVFENWVEFCRDNPDRRIAGRRRARCRDHRRQQYLGAQRHRQSPPADLYRLVRPGGRGPTRNGARSGGRRRHRAQDRRRERQDCRSGLAQWFHELPLLCGGVLVSSLASRFVAESRLNFSTLLN